jgi:hypothetical protein
VPAETANTVAEIVKRFNAEYMVVNEAGKVFVCQWRQDPMLDREVLDYIRHAEFKKLYENRELTLWRRGELVTKTHAEWWLENPNRRQYLRGVCFDPTHIPREGYFNLWRGFAIERKAGDWSLMRNHIVNIVCSGIAERAEYVLNWLARLVQFPHLAGEVAIVMRGAKGCGKGIVGRWIAQLFGRHGLQIVNAIHLTGRFNEHLRDLVVLFADEAFLAGERNHEGVLNGLVTEPVLPIEGKGKPLIAAKNMLHVILASNQEWVIPASCDERRYLMLYVPDTRCGQFDYFAAIERQMKNGGLAAMLDELLSRDISQFEVRCAPKTEELGDQKLLSLPSVERWWVAVLSRGFLWKSRHGAQYFRQWHEFYSTELLSRSYQQWCDEYRLFDRKSREFLGRFMTKVYSASRPRGTYPIYELDSIDVGEVKAGRHLDDASIVRQDRPMGYQVGDLEVARDQFLRHYDLPVEWRSIPSEGWN